MKKADLCILWKARFSKASVLLPVLLFVGCSITTPTSRYQQSQDAAPGIGLNPSQIQDATPKVESRSKWGNKNPYEVRGISYRLLPTSLGYNVTGTASWYGSKFHGHTTSNGETYNMFSMTAAHKTLPIPTYLRVTNLRNGHKVIVRVNDRGPFHGNRVLDVSYAAAVKLGFDKQGTAPVNIEAIDPVVWHQERMRAENPTVAGREVKEGELYLQVAAFSQLASAQRLKQQLATQTSQPIVILRDTRKSPNIHKVQIGPIKGIDVAQQIKQDLQAKGHGNPIIIGQPKI